MFSFKLIFKMKQYLIIIFFLIGQTFEWTVNCDNKGGCTVQISTTNTSIYITQGYLPMNPEKNIIPLKNVTMISNNLWNTNQKAAGFSIMGLMGRSSKYECAGGLNECVNSCCNMGKCSDPQDICVMYSNKIRIIYLIVGFVFLLLFILYWIFFYLLGVFYNTKPIVKKSDNIYIRFAPPKILLNEDKNDVAPSDRFESENNINNGKNVESKIQDPNLIPKINSQHHNNENIVNNSRKNIISNDNHEFDKNFNSEIYHQNDPIKNIQNDINMDAIPEESYKSSLETDPKKKMGDSIFNRKKTQNKSDATQIKYDINEGKALIGDSNEINEDFNITNSTKNINKFENINVKFEEIKMNTNVISLNNKDYKINHENRIVEDSKLNEEIFSSNNENNYLITNSEFDDKGVKKTNL